MAKRSNKAFLKATLAEWQSRYGQPLADEDARAIATNMTDFLRMLMEWASKESVSATEPSPGGSDNGKPNT